jgi:hypothetical protein
LFVAFHITISESWLVEFTETTLVTRAEPELEPVEVVVGRCELLVHPPNAHATMMTRTTLEARTKWDGSSHGQKADTR